MKREILEDTFASQPKGPCTPHTPRTCWEREITSLYLECLRGRFVCYLQGGYLFDVVVGQEHNEIQASSLLVQLCRALAYLHSLNIVHRNIRPDKIVVRWFISSVVWDGVVVKFVALCLVQCARCHSMECCELQIICHSIRHPYVDPVVLLEGNPLLRSASSVKYLVPGAYLVFGCLPFTADGLLQGVANLF